MKYIYKFAILKCISNCRSHSVISVLLAPQDIIKRESRQGGQRESPDEDGEDVSGERRDLYSGILYIQWNLSIKGTLNKGHLCNEDTVCCPNHIELCANLPLN